jgi:hypothetical protein
MGFSLLHQSKTNLLDIIGNHYSDSVVKAVKDSKNLQDTGDNSDMKIHDMQSSHQNQDLHYFASNLSAMPKSFTKCTSKRYHKTSKLIFLLSDEEEIKLREDFLKCWLEESLFCWYPKFIVLEEHDT